ncbi:DUF2242 domain-containing protein [Roseateles koreensis]|uniref:DUF2242 domain-containing protein n=1 Tax=Roseateles koreensis TaxID=2987526 RepID=A0ABT5KRL2_9BURK|nr:DUF2242 domain-containing protein [Roseateles koreensis]MDC8785546.1 DUF2242 domain-containing protein [Roseateles koreensis]
MFIRPTKFMTRALCGASIAFLCSGCGSWGSKSPAAPRGSVYQNERFQSDETFSRLFDASVDDTCEAARRTLLSQGYVITNAPGGSVNGLKRFQPDGEVHVEINFNVVCVPDGRNDKITTAYVSAQQDRYALKKSPNSASLGVSALGSISVPLSASDDSLVKVASETIPAGEFYDRFFSLMQKMAVERAGDK